MQTNLYLQDRQYLPDLRKLSLWAKKQYKKNYIKVQKYKSQYIHKKMFL